MVRLWYSRFWSCWGDNCCCDDDVDNNEGDVDEELTD